MKLGTLPLSSHLILAPMAGITDYPFRQIVREMGRGLTVTEMVSAEGLLRKGRSLLKLKKGEYPVSVQLFGSDPETLAEAAGEAQDMGAALVDLNMGCPAQQVVKAGAGAALMCSPERVKKILTRMRREITCLLTIKIRSGWDEKQINAIEISKLAEECGVDAITVHPRTKAQAFRGQADWNLIARVKRSVRIPVIGNGDVFTPSLIQEMLEKTGVDGVMIGRGALGNPWIFRRTDTCPETSEQGISFEERQNMILRHLSLIEDHYGKVHSIYEMRKHLYWYTKGLPCCKSFHAALSQVKEVGGLYQALYRYFETIQRRKTWPS